VSDYAKSYNHLLGMLMMNMTQGLLAHEKTNKTHNTQPGVAHVVPIRIVVGWHVMRCASTISFTAQLVLLAQSDQGPQ
jgi:hypothetical protein